MKFRNILIFMLFVFLITLPVIGYFFIVLPQQLLIRDLKKENEILALKLSREFEGLNLTRKDTIAFNLPLPILKAKEELSKDFSVETKFNFLKILVFTDDIFLPGGYTLSKDGEKRLLRISEILKEISYKEIELQVHTDNEPIKTKKDLFPTNWELSARRGTEVVRFLIAKGDVPPERIYVSAFGSSRPLSNENSEEGKKKNRRLEILVKF
ncbi:MAG: OmpA family protein [Candidatus Hydrothermales bacterium]